jgi:SAM-dependent methyltransferase
MTVDEAFWRIHENLPRQGPGSTKTTNKLLAKANPRSSIRKAIDMGCGPGRSSLVMAEKGIVVTAIDTHQPFLDELSKQAKSSQLDKLIQVKNMSMDKVLFPAGSFNLVWSEGTSYIIGFQNALLTWKKLLAPEGKMVITDSFWLTDNRSPKAVEFWKADPLMMTIEQAVKVAVDSGYSVDYQYLQPDSDWFDEYYTPMEQRLKSLSTISDEGMHEALSIAELEINIRKKYGEEYGHIGLVLSRA